MTLQTKIEITDTLLADALAKFEAFGVTKDMIEKRIQRHYSTITPALMVSLRKIYNSLRDGMSAPAEWFEMGDAPAAAITQPPKGATRTSDIKSRMKKGRGKPADDTVTDVDQPAAKRAAPASAPPAATPKKLTFAEVADALNAAGDSDALAAAADLIRHVADDGQRSELTTLYSDRAAKFDDTGAAS
jgi:hypothetical protein